MALEKVSVVKSMLETHFNMLVLAQEPTVAHTSKDYGFCAANATLTLLGLFSKPADLSK